MAVRRLVAELGLRPLADQLARLEVVGGDIGVGGGHGIERRVEGDDDDAGVARLLDGRHDGGRVARHQQDALGARRHQLLDRGDLAVVVAVELAGVGLRREAELLGLGLEALLHLDEERVGVGLGDEADDVSGVRRRAISATDKAAARDGRENSRKLGHRFPPGEVKAASIVAAVAWTLRALAHCGHFRAVSSP